MSKKFNSIQFSADPYRLTRSFLADPEIRAEVMRAVSDGPATTMTEQLGYANLAEEGQEADWHTLFAGTRKEKTVGESGLFLRAKKSGFALLRLRKQTQKAQTVDTSAATPDLSDAAQLQAVLAALNITPEQLAELSRAAYRPEAVVAEDVDAEFDDEPTKEYVLPESIAAIIAKR